MVTIKCDYCGFRSDMRPPRPLYSVEIQARMESVKGQSIIDIDSKPLEVTDYCVCGKCLTKLNAHIAGFFLHTLEDKQ